MRPAKLAVAAHHPYSVGLNTSGGETTNPLWTSEISNEAFGQAIREAITENGLFRSVVSVGQADYLLEVTLINVDKPMAGLDLTANVTVSWKLTRVATHKIVFQSVVSKSYTATMGDALVAIKRLRLAEEGAARESIQEGLLRLSRLQLTGTE